jgi:ribonuclease BN (tRNA processing enzyme)
MQTILLKNKIRSTLIRQVFITHVHGDHVNSSSHYFLTFVGFWITRYFFLIRNHGYHLALLCLLAMQETRSTFPNVEVYGPPGLRKFVRQTMHFTKSQLPPGAVLIHELHNNNFVCSKANFTFTYSSER